MNTNVQEQTLSPGKCVYRAFADKYEQTAFNLLLLWCLLPLMMFAVDVVYALTGRFPTLEELAADGLELGYINYDNALAVYQKLFFTLGIVTVCFALFVLILSWRRVFSLRSLRDMPWFYLFALFLVWASACAMLSDYRHYSLVGGDYMRDGLVSYFIYGGVFLCASMLRREDYRRKLMLSFIGVIGFLALIMLVQEKFDIFFLDYCFPSTRAVVFNQFNHFGYMLCMTAAACLGFLLYEMGKKSLKYLYSAGFLYLLLALVVNDTFGSLLALIAAVPVVLILYVRSGRKLNRRALALMLLAGVLFVVLAGNVRLLYNLFRLGKDTIKIVTHSEDAAKAGTERFGLWMETVAKIRKRPIFGYGPQGLIRRHALSGARMPHNTYLQIAAYTGIPGLVVYISAMLTLGLRQWKRLKTLDTAVLIAAGGAFAYMVSQTFGVPIYNAEPYFWLFLGLAALGPKQDKPLLCLE